MNALEPKVHPIGINVMRLMSPKPELHLWKLVDSVMTTRKCNIANLPSSVIPLFSTDESYSNQLLINESFSVSLPTAVGNVYVGEEFFAYIHISNCAEYPCDQVSVTVDINNGSTSRTLVNTVSNATDLNPGAYQDFRISFLPNTANTYTMTVNVSYSCLGIIVPRVMKKNFRFQVQPLLYVSKRILPNHSNNSYLVEMLVENSSTNLETISLHPPIFTPEKPTEISGKLLFPPSKNVILNSGSSWQFLIEVEPISNSSPNADNKEKDLSAALISGVFSGMANPLGVVTLRWDGGISGNGSQSVQVLSPRPPVADMVAGVGWIVNVPSKIYLEVPFKVQVAICYRSEHDMQPEQQLRLEFHNQGDLSELNVFSLGSNVKVLENLKAGEVKILEVDLVALGSPEKIRNANGRVNSTQNSADKEGYLFWKPIGFFVTNTATRYKGPVWARSESSILVLDDEAN